VREDKALWRFFHSSTEYLFLLGGFILVIFVRHSKKLFFNQHYPEASRINIKFLNYGGN